LIKLARPAQHFAGLHEAERLEYSNIDQNSKKLSWAVSARPRLAGHGPGFLEALMESTRYEDRSAPMVAA
jgi:hypothetical protein